MGFAALWAIGWGIVGAAVAGSEMNSLSPAELDESIWSVEGPLMIVYGMSPALAALLGGIGALIYSRTRSSTIWMFGIGATVGLGAALVLMQGSYLPRLFGVGGALILLSFFGILWFWARDRLKLQGSSTVPANFRLAGYVFLLMATWFTCGIGSQPFLDGLEGRDPTNPIHIMLLLTFGWVSLLLSHYTAARLQQSNPEDQPDRRARDERTLASR